MKRKFNFKLFALCSVALAFAACSDDNYTGRTSGDDLTDVSTLKTASYLVGGGDQTRVANTGYWHSFSSRAASEYDYGWPKEISILEAEKADNFYIEGNNLYLSSNEEVINPDNPVSIGSHAWNDLSDDSEFDKDTADEAHNDKADDFTVINNKLYLSSSGKVINPKNPVDIGSHTWDDLEN